MVNKYGIPSLLSILDLSVKEIDELVSTAEHIIANPKSYMERCKGKKLAYCAAGFLGRQMEE